jgi:hypothetical protein
MPQGLDKKTMKLKRGDKDARVRGPLTAVKVKQDMYILTNMHRSPTEGNFCDKQGRAQKLTTGTGTMLMMGIEWLFN